MSGNYIGSGPAPGGMILVGDTNPVGMVNWFHAVPDGSWLQLNGQIVAKATYPDLWTWAQGFLTADQTANPGLYRSVDASTFALPNLQGLFLRSVGGTAPNAAAALGVKQGFATAEPTSVPAGQTAIWTGGASGGFVSVNTSGGSVHGNFAADLETRPVNVALVPCVKAKRTTLVAAPATLPGRLLQVQSHIRTDTPSSAVVIPQDDTIPQITEGVEFFSVPITPLQIGSRMRARVLAYFTQAAAANENILAALFRAGQANALVAAMWAAPQNSFISVLLETEVVPVDMTPITFSARMGPGVANTVRMNAAGASRFLGGAMTGFLKVEEYST